MNKEDLIQAMGDDIGSKKDAKLMCDSILNNISEALKNGDEVRLAGFGTFKLATRKERTAVNPQSGAKILVPEKKVAKFIPHTALKTAINPE